MGEYAKPLGGERTREAGTKYVGNPPKGVPSVREGMCQVHVKLQSPSLKRRIGQGPSVRKHRKCGTFFGQYHISRGAGLCKWQGDLVPTPSGSCPSWYNLNHKGLNSVNIDSAVNRKPCQNWNQLGTMMPQTHSL